MFSCPAPHSTLSTFTHSFTLLFTPSLHFSQFWSLLYIMISKLAIAAVVGQAAAFPWVATMPGVDSSLFKRQAPGSAAACPTNPNHKGAVPYNPKYPYCHAKDGLPGVFPCNNNLVPANGDTAHAWTAPGPLDIRGPCPGLNTAANHNVRRTNSQTFINADKL